MIFIVMTELAEYRRLTPSNKILLDKLTITQIVKKVPSFFGTRTSIIVFTRLRHCSISWARWSQSTSHYILPRYII